MSTKITDYVPNNDFVHMYTNICIIKLGVQWQVTSKQCFKKTDPLKQIETYEGLIKTSGFYKPFWTGNPLFLILPCANICISLPSYHLYYLLGFSIAFIPPWIFYCLYASLDFLLPFLEAGTPSSVNPWLKSNEHFF